MIKRVSGLTGRKGNIKTLRNHRKRGTQAQLSEILAWATICAFLNVSDRAAIEQRHRAYLARTASAARYQFPSPHACHQISQG
jgi:hypothetical protein